MCNRGRAACEIAAERCSGIALRARLIKKSSWLVHLIRDKAPPVAHDSGNVARTLDQRCYPHTGNGGYRWCLSSSLSWSVGLSIQDEAHGCCPARATRGSIPCRRYLRVPLNGNEEGSKGLMVLAHANSVPDPVGQHTLTFYTTPVGLTLASRVQVPFGGH